MLKPVIQLKSRSAKYYRSLLFFPWITHQIFIGTTWNGCRCWDKEVAPNWHSLQVTARIRKSSDLLHEHVGWQENAVLDYAFISIKVETGISDATIFQWNLFKWIPNQVFISRDLGESRKTFFNLGQHSVNIRNGEVLDHVAKLKQGMCRKN